MNYDIFKSLLDDIAQPIWIMNLELKFIYINDFYKNIYGRTNEDTIGIDCTKVLNKNICDIIKQKYNLILKDKQSLIIDDYLNGDNIKIKVAPILNDHGHVSAISGVYIIDDCAIRKNEKVRIEKRLINLKNKYNDLKKVAYIDLLTEVYNRNYYEKISKKLVNEKYFPLGIIMGDANGLKLINDTLGHSQGDKLLKFIAKILQETCGENDYVFRFGGDEFVILTPNTTDYKCENLIKNIFEKCKKYDDKFIDMSISLGFSIIDDKNKDINLALKEAEDKVYLQKLLQKNSLSSSILYSLKTSMEEKSYETEEHSNRVVKYSVEIGKLLALPLSEMDELVLVANLHDIGKIGIDESILLKSSNLTSEEFEIVKSHTEKGYRILKASNQLDSVAKGVLTHHERWDGNGYPLKLKGEEIPLVARIVTIADAYDVMTMDTVYKKALTKIEAINELKKNAGYQFDPRIVDIFVKYLENDNETLKTYK